MRPLIISFFDGFDGGYTYIFSPGRDMHSTEVECRACQKFALHVECKTEEPLMIEGQHIPGIVIAVSPSDTVNDVTELIVRLFVSRKLDRRDLRVLGLVNNKGYLLDFSARIGAVVVDLDSNAGVISAIISPVSRTNREEVNMDRRELALGNTSTPAKLSHQKRKLTALNEPGWVPEPTPVANSQSRNVRARQDGFTQNSDWNIPGATASPASRPGLIPRSRAAVPTPKASTNTNTTAMEFTPKVKADIRPRVPVGAGQLREDAFLNPNLSSRQAPRTQEPSTSPLSEGPNEKHAGVDKVKGESNRVNANLVKCIAGFACRTFKCPFFHPNGRGIDQLNSKDKKLKFTTDSDSEESDRTSSSSSRGGRRDDPTGQRTGEGVAVSDEEDQHTVAHIGDKKGSFAANLSTAVGDGSKFPHTYIALVHELVKNNKTMTVIWNEAQALGYKGTKKDLIAFVREMKSEKREGI